MKKIISTLTVLFVIVHLFGQTNYEPEILILSPGKVTYDKALEREIIELDDQIKKDNKQEEQAKYLNSADFQNNPQNIKEIIKSEIAFSKNMDFARRTSFMCEQFLAYRFFEKFPHLLLILKDRQSNGQLEELKKLSEEFRLRYVLNFPTLSFYRETNISYAKLAVQLYDHATNSLLIDTTYIGDWNNPGFEFACSDSTLSCTISNAIAQALDQVIYHVAINSPTLQKERTIALQRLDFLRNEYYSKPFDKSFVVNIIGSKDSDIVIDDLYQLLINDDKTKFVGFFINKKNRYSLRQLNENKSDNNIKILNNKDIRDTGYLDNLPQTYAYIVKGVKYKNKWYYEKAEVTYFHPQDNQEGRLQYFNNLQQWGFFKDNSTSFNPDFWETNHFEKVRDLRQDPDWHKYGKTIWKTEEEENRSFLGLYKIVAEQLKTKKTNQTKRISFD